MGLFEYLNLDSIIRSFQSTNKFRNTVEIREPTWLNVDGSIPAWLNGVLYRVGPGKYVLGDDSKSYVIQHAFDGLTFAHRFEILSGQNVICYNSRYTAEGVEKNLLEDPSKITFFGHIGESKGIQRFFDVLGRIDRSLIRPRSKIEGLDTSGANVGVTITPGYPLPSSFTRMDDDDRVLVSKTDANVLLQVNSYTLEPKRLFDYSAYNPQLSGPISAAHPQTDSETGEVFNYVLKFGMHVQFTVFSIDKDGKTKVLAEITHRKLPNGDTSEPIRGNYVHSFWLTKNYIILPESPLHHTNNGIDIPVQGALVPGLAWDEHSPTYLHVIKRDGSGLMVSVPVQDTFFMFHSTNAWETHNPDGSVDIELDCCSYKNGDVMHQIANFGIMERVPPTKRDQSSTKLRGISFPPAPFEFGNFCRYTIHLSKDDPTTPTGPASCHPIARNVEFPRINPTKHLTPYQYLWACRQTPVTEERPEGFSLVKIDAETGNTLELDRDGHMFTEPVFVPRPEATAEDDGVLLSLANITDKDDPDKDKCAMVIVDAASMKELARAVIGNFGTLTFHGSFVSDTSFQNNSTI